MSCFMSRLIAVGRSVQLIAELSLKTKERARTCPRRTTHIFTRSLQLYDGDYELDTLGVAQLSTLMSSAWKLIDFFCPAQHCRQDRF